MNDHKREQLEAVLGRGTVLIYIDGRGCSGLPAPFNMERRLILRVGHDVSPPMSITFGEFGFGAAVQFGPTSADVRIPWPMLFAFVSEAKPGLIVSYPDDLPLDVAPEREPTPPLRNGLRIVS